MEAALISENLPTRWNDQATIEINYFEVQFQLLSDEGDAYESP